MEKYKNCKQHYPCTLGSEVISMQDGGGGERHHEGHFGIGTEVCILATSLYNGEYNVIAMTLYFVSIL